jgi:hypothetical protein
VFDFFFRRGESLLIRLTVSRARVALLSTLMIAIAPGCDSSPADPGDGSAHCTTCVVQQVDLRTDTVLILTPLTRDSARKRDVASAGPITLLVLITNLSDTASLPGTMGVGGGPPLPGDTVNFSPTFPLPSIPAHATIADTITVRYWDYYDSPFLFASAHTFFVFPRAANEVNLNNNGKRSPSFFIAKATLAVAAATPAPVRVNQSFRYPFNIRNDGYVSSPPVTVVGCLILTRLCTSYGWTPFSPLVIPPIAPGQTYVVQDSMRVAGSSAFQDEEFRYTLQFCPAETDPWYSSGPCIGSVPITVQPDYEGTCHPPTVTPEAPVIFTSYNCGLPANAAEPDAGRFHLVRVDAAAGHVYRVDRSDRRVLPRIYDTNGVQIDDGDPAADRFSVAVSGRYYIVLYDIQPLQTVSLVAL